MFFYNLDSGFKIQCGFCTSFSTSWIVSHGMLPVISGMGTVTVGMVWCSGMVCVGRLLWWLWWCIKSWFWYTVHVWSLRLCFFIFFIEFCELYSVDQFGCGWWIDICLCLCICLRNILVFVVNVCVVNSCETYDIV